MSSILAAGAKKRLSTLRGRAFLYPVAERTHFLRYRRRKGSKHCSVASVSEALKDGVNSRCGCQYKRACPCGRLFLHLLEERILFLHQWRVFFIVCLYLCFFLYAVGEREVCLEKNLENSKTSEKPTESEIRDTVKFV